MKDIVIIANFCRDFSETDNGRFMYLCKELSTEHKVEIITSDFIHGMNRHKKPLNHSWPFTITFLHEPGYKKNISIQRFISHHAWGKEVKRYLKKRKKPDVVYCAVPSLTAPYEAAKYCERKGVRFIIDIQDLWPEAFRMVFKVPVMSEVIFAPFKHRADEIYKRADAVCGVSETYVERGLSVNRKCRTGITVFLGTDMSTFDEYAKEYPVLIKQNNEVWLAYCGTLGNSYDLTCVIDALGILKQRGIKIKLVVMGSGQRKDEFEKYAKDKEIDNIFTGRLPYDQMCALLSSCDITVNPIMHNAAQSIINKHGDYASGGLPVVSTQENDEYRELVKKYQMGFNCKNGDAKDLADKLEILALDKELRQRMGRNARQCAEEKFDRAHTYKALENVILESDAHFCCNGGWSKEKGI